jgi:hypothetical protein
MENSNNLEVQETRLSLQEAEEEAFLITENLREFREGLDYPYQGRIYSQIGFFKKLFNYISLLRKEKKARKLNGVDYDEFKEFGITMFCGRQGAGKTISMVEYLERMRQRYPKVKIITNFGYKYEDEAFTSWKQFFEPKNGNWGVIYALDELHSEFSSADYRDFNTSLLREITQQRKQRVKIIGSAQVYARLVKALRESTYQVVNCRTRGGLWTFTKTYDAEDYNSIIDSNSLDKMQRIKPLSKDSFIQDDHLRTSFDTYAKIEAMHDKKFIPEAELTK